MTSGYSRLSQALFFAVCVFIPFCAPSPAPAADPRRIEETGIPDGPWPVLQDGRLLFEVFGRQIALSPCADCKVYTEFHTMSRTAEPHWFSVGLDGAIKSPGPLRHALNNADEVTILTATVPKTGLLFDRVAQPQFYRFTITLFRKPSKGFCQYEPPWSATSCESLVGLSTKLDKADANGFVSIETFAGVGGATVFIPVAEHLRAVTGVPPFIICLRYANPWRENSENIEGQPGNFFLAADLAVAFNFNRQTVPESEWMSLFEKARSVVEAVVNPVSVPSR